MSASVIGPSSVLLSPVVGTFAADLGWPAFRNCRHMRVVARARPEAGIPPVRRISGSWGGWTSGTEQACTMTSSSLGKIECRSQASPFRTPR
jgi:hypothetical protein